MRSRVLVVAAAVLVLWQGVAAAGPGGYPNDPGYAPVEAQGVDCSTKGVAGGEQHNLYSFMPRCTPLAHDPENASGMSVDKAWNYSKGSPNTIVAYVEGGINWHDPAARELADKVYLNTAELPLPWGCKVYDCNGDGVVSVADYANDPRVHDSNHNGYLDPEDLIAAFSTGQDKDHNGFASDISGWDFYEHQNDPATSDATYGHANNQMRTLAAQTNNGLLGAGICPLCRILPIRAGQEALDRTDQLAQAWLYADQMGAKVVVSTTADLGYSSYMKQVVEKLWRDGVLMVESSNDFGSTDHQGGMFWPHVLPGNGLVANSTGVSGGLGNALTSTYRTRSGQTSFGSKAMFSVSTTGGSTSESTPTTGGIFGLLMSYKPDLTNDEAIQVMRATASGIDDPTLGWPGKPGWNRQYGYGRPNVAKAMQAVADGNIPPVGWISSPDWYSLYDPARTSSVDVSGHVAAPRSSGYRYELQWAPGIEPADSAFRVAGSGHGTQAYDGRLGTLDLRTLPRSFWTAPYQQATDKALSATEQYTVTVRLRVWDAAGRMGEERRTIAVHHDPSLRAGFPLKTGVAGESQPVIADLQGTGSMDLVFGNADGVVHALDARTLKELPGWPVRTLPVAVQRTYPGIDPGHEPIIAPVTVGDLNRDGRLSVVVTSTTGHTYVFDAHGRQAPGWPRALDTGVAAPPIPRPALDYTRLPAQGATAPPVLAPLTPGGALSIVQAGWDGRLHAWHPDGTDVPGWPVHVTFPGPVTPGLVLINDQKLDATPAVAYLSGGHVPDIVVRAQYSESKGGGEQFFGANYVFAFHADGSPVAGWPVRLPSIMTFNGSAQEFVTEAVNQPAVADVNGDGRDEVATGPSFGPTYLISGTGKILQTYGPVQNPALDPQQVIGGQLPADVPISFTTSGAFGRFGPLSRIGYAESGSGAASMVAALLFPGSGQPVGNYERGYDAATGLPVPGFPHSRVGLDFLGAPLVVDVTGKGPSLVDGGDTSTLQAFPGGQWFTGGWLIWSPSAGDLSGDGSTDLVATSREGYLFDWRTAGGSAANDQWWTYHHDEWRTGRYGTDTRPPGALRSAVRHGNTVRFVAPGDNWYTGKVASYRVSTAHGVVVLGATVSAGSVETLTVPAGSVTVQAVDAAGNIGAPATFS